MITDADCLARGGQIVTEQTYAHLRRGRAPDELVAPFRICRIPSAKNDATCGGDGDCAGGRCYCTGALARPNPQDDPALRALDGTAGPAAAPTTRCPTASGSASSSAARSTSTASSSTSLRGRARPRRSDS